jgi:hypothetical protein
MGGVFRYFGVDIMDHNESAKRNMALGSAVIIFLLGTIEQAPLAKSHKDKL